MGKQQTFFGTMRVTECLNHTGAISIPHNSAYLQEEGPQVKDKDKACMTLQLETLLRFMTWPNPFEKLV